MSEFDQKKLEHLENHFHQKIIESQGANLDDLKAYRYIQTLREEKKQGSRQRIIISLSVICLIVLILGFAIKKPYHSINMEIETYSLAFSNSKSIDLVSNNQLLASSKRLKFLGFDEISGVSHNMAIIDGDSMLIDKLFVSDSSVIRFDVTKDDQLEISIEAKELEIDIRAFKSSSLASSNDSLNFAISGSTTYSLYSKNRKSTIIIEKPNIIKTKRLSIPIYFLDATKFETLSTDITKVLNSTLIGGKVKLIGSSQEIQLPSYRLIEFNIKKGTIHSWEISSNGSEMKFVFEGMIGKIKDTQSGSVFTPSWFEYVTANHFWVTLLTAVTFIYTSLWSIFTRLIQV